MARPMSNSPPVIFSNARCNAVKARSQALQQRPDAARFIFDDMVEDVAERLAFLRHEAGNALLLGHSQPMANALPGLRAKKGEWSLERPYPSSGFDLIACLGELDTVNDLPGALIHMNRALASGGLTIASFVGAGSLPLLRRIMQAADGERPAPRVHPHIDIQAASDLLQRAGWSDPVVDSHTLNVRYPNLQRLVQDLRDQGLGNALATKTHGLGKAGFTRAQEAFAKEADEDGRVTEMFEIITVTGRRR